MSFDDPVTEAKGGNAGGFDFEEKFEFDNKFGSGKEERFDFS